MKSHPPRPPLSTALLLGWRTHGMGSVQSLHHLENGSVLQLTVSEHLTHQGGRIKSRGVEPHLALPLPGSRSSRSIASYPRDGRDPLLKLARTIVAAAVKAGVHSPGGMKRLGRPMTASLKRQGWPAP